MKKLLLPIILAFGLFAQTTPIPLTGKKVQDLPAAINANYNVTQKFTSGTSIPVSCTPTNGTSFFKTDTKVWYDCTDAGVFSIRTPVIVPPTIPIKDIIGAEARSSLGGITHPEYAKGVTLTTGSTQRIVNASGGPGYLSNIWVAIGGLVAAHDGNVDLVLTVDGVITFTGPYELFFAAYYWTNDVAANFTNDFVQFAGGQKISIPIPFNSTLTIDLKNNDAATLSLWWTGNYVTGIANNWDRGQKLNFAIGTLPLTQDQRGTMLDITGTTKGRVLGIYLLWDGVFTNGPNFLEGELIITADGSIVLQTSGSEDYFGFAGFFAAVPVGYGNRFQSLTLKRISPPLYAGMRFHIGEPIIFDHSLKITIDGGQSDSGNTFTGTIYITYLVWYYTEQ